MPGTYATLFSAWHLFTFNFVPPIILLIFSLSTIINVRKSGRRIALNNSQTAIVQHNHRKSIDGQMIRMMLFQSTIFILTASPSGIYFLYKSVNPTSTGDALQTAKDKFLANCAGFIALTVPCASFYLFTMSSKLFRSELKKLFVSLWQLLHRLSLLYLRILKK